MFLNLCSCYKIYRLLQSDKLFVESEILQNMFLSLGHNMTSMEPSWWLEGVVTSIWVIILFYTHDGQQEWLIPYILLELTPGGWIFFEKMLHGCPFAILFWYGGSKLFLMGEKAGRAIRHCSMNTSLKHM